MECGSLIILHRTMSAPGAIIVSDKITLFFIFGDIKKVNNFQIDHFWSLCSYMC